MLVVLFGGFVFGGASAHAAIVDPESVTLRTLSGETINQEIRYENDTAETQVYTLAITGVSFGASADELFFKEIDAIRSEWIKLSQTEFTLEPGAEQMIELTLAIPEATQSEVFSFAVIAETQTTGDGGVGVASGLATLFFVDIGGELEPQLRIETFETIPHGARQLPVRFATLIANTGDGLAEPDIAISITNIWGQEVALLPLNAAGRRIPGYTNRVFSTEWEGSPWKFGPYTAELYVFPDDSDFALTSSVNVVLFPWRTLSVFIVIGLIFTGLIYALRRVRR